MTQHRTRTESRWLRLQLVGLCALILVAGVATLAGTDGARQLATPACQPVETVDEARYLDFSPTALVITRPCGDTPERPYVVFASYLAPVDGDYYLGREAERAVLTRRDSHHFLFAWLARALARQGIASVRYDPIAIRPRPRDGRAFVGARVVEEDLLRVQRADFSGLLDQVVSRADELLGRSTRTPVVFVGHSGGAFTVGDYLERAHERATQTAQAARPFGFVGLSPAVSDATGILETNWRYWVRKTSSCLTHSSRDACLSQLQSVSLYPVVFHDASLRGRIELIFSQSPDSTTLVNRLDSELSRHARDRERAERAHKDGLALLEGRYAFQQSLFHAMAFREPSARPLSCHTQAATLVLGLEDMLLDASQEAKAWTQACGRAEDVTLLAHLGHSLGTDPYVGPPSREALELVAKSIASVAARLTGSPLSHPSSNTSPPTSPNNSPPSTGKHR